MNEDQARQPEANDAVRIQEYSQKIAELLQQIPENHDNDNWDMGEALLWQANMAVSKGDLKQADLLIANALGKLSTLRQPDVGQGSSAVQVESAGSHACPKCGFGNREEARFCGECGQNLASEPTQSSQEIPTQKICSNGHTNRPQARFCGECGVSLG